MGDALEVIKMKKLTLKKQLLILVVTMLVFQGAIAVIGYTSLQQVRNNLVSVFEVRLPSLNNLVQADRDFQQALVAERTLLIDGLDSKTKKSLAGDYIKNRDQVGERFEEYRNLASSETEKKLAQEFEERFKTWLKVSDRDFGVNANGDFRNGLSEQTLINNSMGQVNKGFEASREKLDLLQEEVLSLGTKEFSSASENFKQAGLFISLFSIFGIGISLFMSWLISRNLSNKIETTAKSLSEKNIDLTKISQELHAKSTSLAEVSQQQAAGVTETSSSLHEISKMVENNNNNAEASATLVKDSENLIGSGIEILNRLKNEIASVEESSQEILGSVEKNNKDLENIIQAFQEIKSKTNVINDIVFQTKLLSFNASVEAARAGEHGKGFSVVAEEIGNLAQESGTSAFEINEMLEDSLAQVSKIIEESKKELERSVSKNKERIQQSVQSSEKCHEAFSEISSKFVRVTQASNEVVSASKEQVAGISEISHAMHEIDSSNGVTSQSANEIAGISQELSGIVSLIGESLVLLENIVGLNSQGLSTANSDELAEESGESLIEKVDYVS